MKFLKRSARVNPIVTLILLDWSVRESFHLLHYLSKQNVGRDLFEVLIVEYYSLESEAIGKLRDQVDTWLLLEMPGDCYYHKHLMYNAGIVLAKGEVCVICDSDAMVKEGFIGEIIAAFARTPQLVLHMDQFRSMRRDFYPFNYPSFDDVLGPGCINNLDGRTTGLLDRLDPIHTRNYGACMCTRRADLIEIGGADEHIDFLGHICGPYDLTFRLVNAGRREVWHDSEFLYHTWHPGQAGVDNYLGPHDGRHVSTTSLAALSSRRIRPLVENAAIRTLREQGHWTEDLLQELLIRPGICEEWSRDNIASGLLHKRFDVEDVCLGMYKGFAVYSELHMFYAHLPLDQHHGRARASDYAVYLEDVSLERLKKQIARTTPRAALVAALLAKMFVYGWQMMHYLRQTSAAICDLAVSKVKAAIVRLIALPARSLGLLRQLLRYLSQFVAEGRALADGLGDLVPSLYFLGRASNLRFDPARVTIIVDSKRTELFLKLLTGTRLVPKVRVVHVSSLDQLDPILAEAEELGLRIRVMITRALYQRCYPLVSERHLDGQVIIL